MKFKKNILFAGIASAALLAASSQAATLITNGDFEALDFTGDAQSPSFSNWVYSGSVALAGDEVDRVPGPNPNQVARFQNNSNGLLAQDLSYTWSTLDTYDLSFNASETWWRTGGTGDAISVSLFQLNGSEMDLAGSETDDVALWTSGFIDLDGTHTQTDNVSPWTAAQTFNYTIVANTDFNVLGTAGENMYIQFKWEDGGTSVAWIDNVSLTAIPEPSSLTLLAGGLALFWLRKRRQA